MQKSEPEVSKVKPEAKSCNQLQAVTLGVQAAEKSNAKPEVVRQTKSEEKTINILLSQESDIQEGHVLLRIPSQQSLDEKPQVDRKSKRKFDCKQDVNKKDSKFEWKSYEEKSEVQKGNFHKNYLEIMIEDISNFEIFIQLATNYS